ncbi:hypothetical protein K435DRAFT_793158 [Dendrothele bispora CBS 962.96]|uniref:Uncharacterized protein n=1 Tax=Dendrothele bispora (strain CBS 962.96) TaxID=1314807 RepID=A0A4S8MHC8_DENBC|nr:hypothetical protein K435DRAFT_793158 [Dendrothele bispora CBS 962.96]
MLLLCHLILLFTRLYLGLALDVQEPGIMQIVDHINIISQDLPADFWELEKNSNFQSTVVMNISLQDHGILANPLMAIANASGLVAQEIALFNSQSRAASQSLALVAQGQKHIASCNFAINELTVSSIAMADLLKGLGALLVSARDAVSEETRVYSIAVDILSASKLHKNSIGLARVRQNLVFIEKLHEYLSLSSTFCETVEGIIELTANVLRELKLDFNTIRGQWSLVVSIFVLCDSDCVPDSLKIVVQLQGLLATRLIDLERDKRWYVDRIDCDSSLWISENYALGDQAAPTDVVRGTAMFAKEGGHGWSVQQQTTHYPPNNAGNYLV